MRFSDLPAFSDHALVDGAFDPLHSGHLAYLQAAHRLTGAPLLCRVATDNDIRYKGRDPFLPQADRAAILEALGVVSAVYAGDRSLDNVITHMRPVALVKGTDWERSLPDGTIDVCGISGVPMLFTDTPKVSSTQLLADWSIRDADRQLDTLEAYMAAQAVTPAERYDREYFEGTWRTTAPAYTLEGRRVAEGQHPEIIARLWPDHTVLDVGCGPGFLVKFLHDLGMDVWGLEPSAEAIALAPKTIKHRIAHGDTAHRRPHEDVVICREVLEHLTVKQAAGLVAELFRLARKAVYITTRFAHRPTGLFSVEDEREVDPTHQTLMTQPLLRALCVLNGGKRRRDWEQTLDHHNKGRVLAYEVSR